MDGVVLLRYGCFMEFWLIESKENEYKKSDVTFVLPVINICWQASGKNKDNRVSPIQTSKVKEHRVITEADLLLEPLSDEVQCTKLECDFFLLLTIEIMHER